MSPSRRQVLTAAGLGAVTAGLGVTPTAAAHPRESTTFVLVPGSTATAYGWQWVVQRLVLAGHRAIALDLPGHGLRTALPFAYQAPQDLEAFTTAPSAVQGLTPDTAARDVVPAIEQAARHGRVVLVGHSLGGAVISRVGNMVPHLIDRIVYISAACATKLRSVLDYLQTPQGSTSELLTLPPTVDQTKVPAGVTRTNGRTNDRTFLDAFNHAVFDGADERTLLNAFNFTQQPDESVLLNTGDARGRRRSWGTIPRTFVRLGRDRALVPALQDLWIRQADALTPANPFRVEHVDAPHGVFLTDPQAIADVLLRQV